MAHDYSAATDRMIAERRNGVSRETVRGNWMQAINISALKLIVQLIIVLLRNLLFLALKIFVHALNSVACKMSGTFVADNDRDSWNFMILPKNIKMWKIEELRFN